MCLLQLKVITAQISWVTWRSSPDVFSDGADANLTCLRFGGGFEMMKDGGDIDGIWTLLGSSMWYVPWHASVVYVSCNRLQHLWRCGTRPIRGASSHRNNGKEVPTCAFPSILQRTGPRAVTDGRK